MSLQITGNTLDTIPAPLADVTINSHKLTNVTDSTSPQDAATKNYVDAQIAAITNQGSGFSGVITGCGVVWTGLLNFTVGAGTYAINGTTYTLAQADLTLSAADATNPRFDVIATNTSSAAVVITGTPAASPLIPTVDPATQLYLTAISVPANATTPGNVTNTILYAENAGSPTEWTSSSSGTTWALASTNNPHAGTKDIEATSLTAGAYVQLQKPSSTIDLSTQNSLAFYIRSKAAWNANRSLTIEFLNAGTLVGNALTFREGSFGFVSSNTTSYQQIVIPISSFNVGNTATNQIRFIAAGSGGSAIGFYLDDVSLQAGVTIGSQNFMVWKGPWSSSTAYIKNDVVSDYSRAWVALLPSTNSEPTDSNTNWQSEAVFGGIPTTYNADFTVAPTTCWPAIGYVTVSNNHYVTIPAGSFMVASLCAGASAPVTTVKPAVDFVTPSITLVDIVGLTFALASGKTYEIEVTLLGNSSTSAGVNHAIAYSGTMTTNSTYLMTANTVSTTVTSSGAVIGSAAATTYWTGANQESIAKMWTIIRTSSSGTISVQILKATSGIATVRAGSRMTVTQLT